MIKDPNETNPALQAENIQHDRRDFMKGAAAAGLIGAIASGSALAQQSRTPGVSPQPNGLPGRAERKPALDLRNPESFAGIAESTRVVMDHFKAVNQRDIKGVADTMHFPYATFEDVKVVVVKTPEDLIAKAPASVNMTTNPERFTDHDGYINAGSYDVFDGLQVYNSDPVQVSIAMSYDRYNATGAKVLRCDGIYALTNNDGRWAIQAMSTIFTPGDQIDMQYPDSVMAARRLRELHTQGYQQAHLPDVWANVRQLGPTVGINANKDNEYGFYQAPPFKNGIKNRLQVTETTQEKLDQIKIDFPVVRDRWKALGMGNWGFDYGGGLPSRMIHQSFNKVHMYQGTTRYTAAGEFVSNTQEMDVVTQINGRWGIAGILGYIINRDRSNDVLHLKG